jgi:hypothetical protein
MSSSRKAMRLPPLKVLRVKVPNKIEPNPCHMVMNHVLGMHSNQHPEFRNR